MYCFPSKGAGEKLKYMYIEDTYGFPCKEGKKYMGVQGRIQDILKGGLGSQ